MPSDSSSTWLLLHSSRASTAFERSQQCSLAPTTLSLSTSSLVSSKLCRRWLLWRWPLLLLRIFFSTKRFSILSRTDGSARFVCAHVSIRWRNASAAEPIAYQDLKTPRAVRSTTNSVCCTLLTVTCTNVYLCARRMRSCAASSQTRL